ncbi:MAG: acyl carrier protein [Anaerolineales bacterium]
MTEIETPLRAYIAENILFTSDGFPYKDTDSFLENGIVDSMSVMELVMFSEKEFGVSIEDKEITPDNFDSVEKMAVFIRSKLSSDSH